MAVRKKSKTAKAKGEPLLSPETLEAIKEDFGDLYSEHEKDIENAVAESEDRKITLSIAVVIDKSESAPQVKTRLRYSQSVTDERIRTLTDPRQPTLFNKDELKPAKSKAKKSASEPPVEDTDPGADAP